MTRGVSPALLAETLTHLQQENDHVKHPVRDRDCRHINGPGAAQTAQAQVSTGMISSKLPVFTGFIPTVDQDLIFRRRTWPAAAVPRVI